MAISYPVALPSTPAFNNLSIMPEVAAGIATSSFVFKQQIYRYDGDRWSLSAQYPPLTIAQAKVVKAFLLSLHGPVGTFLAGDFRNATPSGAVSGTVLVNGGSQVGYALNVDGLAASLTNAFKAGDDIQIGNYLYQIVKDVSANGSGQCSLDIWPALRSSPADNTVVTYTSAKGLFRLDTTNVGWSVDDVSMYDISFTAVEAL